MSNELIAQLEQSGPGMVVQRLRAMARENVLARLEAAEAADLAGGLRDEIDRRLMALQSRLPGLAEREQPELAAVAELQERVVDLTADRVRAQLAYDDRGAIRIGEQLGQIERQIHEHESQLRTLKNTRQEIAGKLDNLQAARAVVATLVV